MLRTGLIVELPAADEVIGEWRVRLDPRAALGVPAHVTLLFPFAPTDRVDDELDGVREVLAATEPFDVTLAATGWFEPGVLWLAPDPDSVFRDLTARLTARFPAYPPYEGAFDDPTPHLTVGDSSRIDLLRTAERDIAPRLPIVASARSVRLMMEQPDGSWRRGEEFSLGAPGRHDQQIAAGRFLDQQSVSDPGTMIGLGIAWASMIGLASVMVSALVPKKQTS